MCCVISWLVKKSDLGILKQGKRNFRMACCRNWSPEMVSLIKVDWFTYIPYSCMLYRSFMAGMEKRWLKKVRWWPKKQGFAWIWRRLQDRLAAAASGRPGTGLENVEGGRKRMNNSCLTSVKAGTKRWRRDHSRAEPSLSVCVYVDDASRSAFCFFTCKTGVSTWCESFQNGCWKRDSLVN